MDERDQGVCDLSSGLWHLLCYHAFVYQQLLVADRHRSRVRSVFRFQFLVHARHFGRTHTARPVHHGVWSDVTVPRYRQFIGTTVGR